MLALFGAINISGTGRIDKDEFADIFYHLDLDISDDYLIKLFNAADKDGKIEILHCLSVCFVVYLFVCLFCVVCLFVYFSVCFFLSLFEGAVT